MELVKKKIHMDRISSRAGTQMVLEEDVNISDNKPDASHLLNSKARSSWRRSVPEKMWVNLRGRLWYRSWYLNGYGGECAPVWRRCFPLRNGSIWKGVSNGDIILTDWAIEDLTVGLINSGRSACSGCGLRMELEEHVEQDNGGGYLS